jgi:hypothetical protein
MLDGVGVEQLMLRGAPKTSTSNADPSRYLGPTATRPQLDKIIRIGREGLAD